LGEFDLLFGRPKAFNLPLRLLNLLRRTTVALSNADFASLKIERLSPSAIPWLSPAFATVFLVSSLSFGQINAT
jgi:hypothetical protein